MTAPGTAVPPLVRTHDNVFCFDAAAEGRLTNGQLELSGRLPISTHGGQLGEGCIHGVNGIAEGVRLVRGSSVSQPGKAVTNVGPGGSPVPHSALVLVNDY